MKLAIYQPVVPKYRLSLFNAIADRQEGGLQVFASKHFPGAPWTVEGPFRFSISLHDVKAFFRQRVFWQYGLKIPSGFGAGDVIIISGNLRLLSNIPLIWNAKRLGIGVVWWGHGRSSRTTKFSSKIRLNFMRLADAILLYTEKEATSFQAILKHPCMFGANNTRDIREIEELKRAWSSDKMEQFRREMNLVDKDLVLFCSRLNADKRLDVLVEAIAIVAETNKTITLAVIGDGSDRPRLENLATRLGVNDRIRWLGAIYEEGLLAPWFLAAQIFVYPGPIGLSIIHSFAYGLPAITHDNEKNHGPEFAALKPGINGLTFPQGDVTCFAAAIKQLIASPQDRLRMADAAYQTVCEDFSMDRIEVLPNNFSVYFQYLSAASIKTALFINRLGLIFLNQPPFP